MTKRARWLAALAICLALPFLALGVAIAVVDPDEYKPDIAGAVEKATGRALSLSGPLRVSRSLWPTIEIDDVKLANLPGGSRPDMARAERIEARLSLLSLLRRRIEVTSLTLIGPNILFEQVGGEPNWVFKAPGFSGESEAAPSQPSDVTIRFRKVNVQNGMVTTRLPARTNVIGIRTLDFRRVLDDGPLDASAVLVYSDNQPFSLAASAAPTGSVTDPWKTRLAFAAYDTRATAIGTMDLGGGYDLRIEGTSPVFEKLNALLPELRLPALRELRLSTHLRNGPVRGDLPVIGETALDFASADLGDRATGLKLGTVDLSLPAPGGLAAYSGTGTLTGQGFAFKGSVGIPEHPDGKVDVPLELSAQARPAAKGRDTGGSAEGGLSIKGQLTLDTLRFAGLDGSVQLRTPALARLRPVVSPALPALTSVALDGNLTVPANTTFAALRSGRLSSDQGEIRGDVAVGLGPNIAFKGKLRSTRLDADALLTAIGPEQVAASGAAGSKVIPELKLPWNSLRGPAIDLAADVDAMVLQGQTWRDMQLALTLDKGRLHVNRLRLALPGGSINASLTADASADPVPVSLTMHAPKVPLALIAQYAGLPGEVTGSMRIDAELRASGSSVRDITASLDGPLSATSSNGSMSNDALVKLASGPLQELGIAVPPQGRTAIRCFGLVGSFSKGIGDFASLAVDTTYLKLAGEGKVDLATERMAFRLYAFAQVSGSPVKVPVVIEGPLDNPTGRLDASGLDQLGFLINAWLGGDESTICSDAGLLRLGPSPSETHPQPSR